MFQILVVDDDQNVRRYLGALLAEAGYCPHTVSSASEALAIMGNISVDLVVLDVMMPGMDGYEFTKLLRESNCDLPILMLSARQMPDNIKHGFLAGTDDYMTKPCDEEELLLRIQLLEDIWGPDSESMEATVSVHINRLRKRFEGNPDFEIITIRGLGYKAQIMEETEL